MTRKSKKKRRNARKKVSLDIPQNLSSIFMISRFLVIRWRLNKQANKLRYFHCKKIFKIVSNHESDNEIKNCNFHFFLLSPLACSLTTTQTTKFSSDYASLKELLKYKFTLEIVDSILNYHRLSFVAKKKPFVRSFGLSLASIGVEAIIIICRINTLTAKGAQVQWSLTDWNRSLSGVRSKKKSSEKSNRKATTKLRNNLTTGVEFGFKCNQIIHVIMLRINNFYFV